MLFSKKLEEKRVQNTQQVKGGNNGSNNGGGGITIGDIDADLPEMLGETLTMK